MRQSCGKKFNAIYLDEILHPINFIFLFRIETFLYVQTVTGLNNIN